MEEKPDNYIDFSVKYKDWIAIKRLSITDKVNPEEVAYTLASINYSIDSKIYKFLGIDTDKLDELSKDLTKGVGKGYPGLSSAISMLDDKKIKANIKTACKTDVVKPFAESYLVNRIAQNLNLNTNIDLKKMQKAFPDLKIKLPKGFKK
jgi:hypothetical protein